MIAETSPCGARTQSERTSLVAVRPAAFAFSAFALIRCPRFFEPVFHLQPRDMVKVPHVPGHQDQTCRFVFGQDLEERMIVRQSVRIVVPTVWRPLPRCLLGFPPAHQRAAHGILLCRRQALHQSNTPTR